MVEFVSATNRPFTYGECKEEPGDCIAGVLKPGYNVTREFYINDGNQIEKFGMSLKQGISSFKR